MVNAYLIIYLTWHFSYDGYSNCYELAGGKMFWRSKDILKRPENSIKRSLFKSMGFSDEDLSKPIIAIANSYNNICTGHFGLNAVAEKVKEGIRAAGGTPVEFGTIAACDGIAEALLACAIYCQPGRL